MPMPDIPLEIVDLILERPYIIDEKSLKSCSVVCKSWRPFACQFLWREVSLYDPSRRRIPHKVAFAIRSSVDSYPARYIHIIRRVRFKYLRLGSVQAILAAAINLRDLELYEKYGVQQHSYPRLLGIATREGPYQPYTSRKEPEEHDIRL